MRTFTLGTLSNIVLKLRINRVLLHCIVAAAFTLVKYMTNLTSSLTYKLINKYLLKHINNIYNAFNDNTDGKKAKTY